jgi:hypothetical protein
MLNTIQGKIQKKISQISSQISEIPSELAYRAERVKHTKNLPPLSPSDRLIVETCNKEGVFVTSVEELGLTSTAQLLKATRSQLDCMERVLFTNGGDKKSSGNQTDAVHPQIFTVTDLPEFFSWGSEQRLLNIVENYIGLPSTFQGVHLRRDFANKNPVTTEFWHQDLEDRRMLKIIIYLSDVSEENGPFEYIPKSVVSPLLSWRINYAIYRAHALGASNREIEKIVPRSAWKSCPGRAGTVIFMDPVAIFHHGKSRKTERSALFFVYTAKQPRRPEHCTQYSDQTFARPELSLVEG